MTKSDNPQDGGAVYAQPQQMQNPGQQIPPAQLDPRFANPGVANPQGQVPLAHGQAPMQQQVAAQLPPPALPGTPHEAQGGYAAPQGYQPAPVAQPAMTPQFEAPVDDYQYPQGHSVLPDVPAVAIPPAMQAPADQALAAAPPQMPGMQPQVADGGYGEQMANASTGEQISQRLAQLQNQYDQEVSTESWVEPQAAQAATHQAGEQFSAQQPVSQEYAGHAPQPYAEGEQYAQPDDMAQNYQEQAPQTFQQPAQGYQEPPQAQFAPPPPMQTPQGSYEYAGPTPDSGHQQYGHEEQLYGDGSSIPQEQTSGGGIKKVMFGGAFIAALAVGGGAAYTYQYTDLFGSGNASGAAPTIKAASSPIKFLKKKIAGAGDSINKAMHNRLSGAETPVNGATDVGAVEKVVDLGTNIAGNKVAEASKGMMPDAGNIASGGSLGMNIPRRVKTLIVRPDGTILRPAGAEVAKAKEDVVKKTVSITGPVNNANSISAPRAGAFNTASGNKIRRMKTIGEASSARILGENTVSSLKESLATPPKQQIVRKTIVKKIVKAKKSTVVANVAPARNTGNVGKPFVVQVTSRSSQTSALAAFADMQQKYPNLIGPFAPDIQRADLGTKGVWYRLRVGPVGSKVAASDLCSSLKQAGHPGCFVRRK